MNIYLLFGLVGITFIITDSKIVAPIRNLFGGTKIGEMLECGQCTGFWVGIVYYCLNTNTNFNTTAIVEMFINGGLVSGVAYMIHYYFGYLDEKELESQAKRHYYFNKGEVIEKAKENRNMLLDVRDGLS